MGRGLDSLIKGKSQVIKMARGCFESNVVFVYRTFVNLHLIQIKVVSKYRLVSYTIRKKRFRNPTFIGLTGVGRVSTN